MTTHLQTEPDTSVHGNAKLKLIKEHIQFWNMF